MWKIVLCILPLFYFWIYHPKLKNDEQINQGKYSRFMYPNIIRSISSWFDETKVLYTANCQVLEQHVVLHRLHRSLFICPDRVRYFGEEGVVSSYLVSHEFLSNRTTQVFDHGRRGPSVRMDGCFAAWRGISASRRRTRYFNFLFSSSRSHPCFLSS